MREEMSERAAAAVSTGAGACHDSSASPAKKIMCIKVMITTLSLAGENIRPQTNTLENHHFYTGTVSSHHCLFPDCTQRTHFS